MNAIRSLRPALVACIAVVLLLIGTPPGISAQPVVAATGLEDDMGSPDGLSRIEQVHQLFDAVFNHGDADAAAALVAADATIQTDYMSYVGPEGLVNYVAFLRRSYLNVEFDVTRIEMRGDTVEVRWTMSATGMIMDPNEPSVEMDIARSGTVTLTVGESLFASFALKTDFQRSTS